MEVSADIWRMYWGRSGVYVILDEEEFYSLIMPIILRYVVWSIESNSKQTMN
jgi:hypothetical protein